MLKVFCYCLLVFVLGAFLKFIFPSSLRDAKNKKGKWGSGSTLEITFSLIQHEG